MRNTGFILISGAGLTLSLIALALSQYALSTSTTLTTASLSNDAELQIEVTGPEGDADILESKGMWENLRSPYKDAVEKAKTYGTCTLTEGFQSPTGKLPNQGNHHWNDRNKNFDYTKIQSLDWSTKFGNPIYAPFSGTVTYVHQTTNNKCGNSIHLTNGAEKITICHVKDFLNSDNAYTPGTQVTQGQMIGHAGGKCCLGQEPPSGWVTPCQAEGTICNDPTKPEDCQCQPYQQAGNSTGPHVHVTLKSETSNLLACLE